MINDKTALEYAKALDEYLESKCNIFLVEGCKLCPYTDTKRLCQVDSCMNVGYSDEFTFTIKVLEAINE